LLDPEPIRAFLATGYCRYEIAQYTGFHWVW